MRPILNQQINTDTTTNNVHMFIIEVLLLARNNENRPEGQDIETLKYLLNRALIHQVLPIIHLLMEKEILEDRDPFSAFYNFRNLNYLIRNSENTNIITLLLAHNHLRERISLNLAMMLWDPYLNYAKESFDRTESINYLTALKIAPLLLDLLPINTKFCKGPGSLLMLALYLNDKATVKKLLDCDINFKDLNYHGQTALHFVQSLDNENEAIIVAKDIIEKGKLDGSDIHRFDQFGHTPIHYAYLKYYMKLATFLLNIECSNIPKSLFRIYSVNNLALLAANNNSLKLLKCILENYSDIVNVSDFYGITPLMLAAANGAHNIELIILLLNKGANIISTDKSSKSTLTYLYKFIINKIKNLIQNPGDKEKLSELKEILLKRLEEIKNANVINPIQGITQFQEFLEKI